MLCCSGKDHDSLNFRIRTEEVCSTYTLHVHYNIVEEKLIKGDKCWCGPQMSCSSLLDYMFSSLDLWSCLSMSGPTVSRLLHLIKVTLCLTLLVMPFFSLLLLFYYCFLSLSVLLNSRTQMSSLFSSPLLFLVL